MKMEICGEPGCPAEIGFETHIGGRSGNQDAGWLAPQSPELRRMGRLLAVADGMGGHNGGEIASRYACNCLNNYYANAHAHKRQLQARLPDLCRYLADLVYRIDRSLRCNALKDPALENMGTTLSCLVLTAQHTIIAHVGDSRIYRLRRGHLSCLTQDHTFVQEMIFEGELTPRKAATHPLRHVLTQAVGAGEPLEIVHTRIDRRLPFDRFLLCTDGLHNTIEANKIAALMSRESSAAEIARALISEALASKARDNVTVMVIKPQPPVISRPLD